MKVISIPFSILAATVLLPGCANLRPSPDTSRAVLASLATSETRDQPWRLGVSWQSGGPGGAALRSASDEHVVRKRIPAPLNSVSGLHLQGSPMISPIYSEEDIERAWRKFCRHRIDMTERDRRIVRDTPIPDRRLGQCYSGGLMK
jgi:hypothetical protein